MLEVYGNEQRPYYSGVVCQLSCHEVVHLAKERRMRVQCLPARRNKSLDLRHRMLSRLSFATIIEPVHVLVATPTNARTHTTTEALVSMEVTEIAMAKAMVVW